MMLNTVGPALADKFNVHFLSYGESSQKQDRKYEIDQYIVSPVGSSIFLNPCCEHEVFTILKNLDKSTASGVDEIKAEPIQLLPISSACPCSIYATKRYLRAFFQTV